jgi:hypothetical protein
LAGKKTSTTSVGRRSCKTEVLRVDRYSLNVQCARLSEVRLFSRARFRGIFMRDFGLSRCSCVVFTIAAVGVAVLMSGCGEKVQMKPLPNTAQIGDPDKAKVIEHLEKAGKKGKPIGITDRGDHWLVEFDPEPIAVPGRRVVPVGPESVRIDKATGTVVSDVAGGVGGGSQP